MNDTRRGFLKRAAAVVGAPILAGLDARASDRAPGASGARGDDELRVALVGCGARGTAAARQALTTPLATGGRVRLVAVADAFADQIDEALAKLARKVPEAVDVPPERRFVGLDAFRRALDTEVDVALLCAPPGFRPPHFEHAVARGLHVFMEKPVAVDAPGVRRVLRAAEAARAARLKVGVGFQRRHSRRYREAVRRIRNGEIGDVVLVRTYGNVGGVWTRPRDEGWTETEYQVRNWYYFAWLSGDLVVEHHVAGLDVACWILGGHPTHAQGQGGRQVRTGPDHGQIFDHHSIEYGYADGRVLLAQCRQIPNTWGCVDELVTGTRGRADVGAGVVEPAGRPAWRFEGDEPDPYQAEQDALFRAIRDGTEHDEVERAAESTLTAILGRMASYSGQVVSWDEALRSELSLAPGLDELRWDGAAPARNRKHGGYYVPVPGQVRAR